LLIEPSMMCIEPGSASVPSTEPNPTGVSAENRAAGPSVNGTPYTTDGWPRYA
jgi:hypothetical protein